MTTKRYIDAVREGAARMSVGGTDEGAVSGFVKLGGRLLIIKERAVYEVLLADSIDPERTNPDIPNAHQRILSIGSESQLLGRTLLTADRLLDQQFFPPTINCDSARQSALDVALHLAAVADDVGKLEEETVRAFQGLAGSHAKHSFTLPSISGLEAKCKASFHRAHDSIKSSMDIARVFYGKSITHPDSLDAYLRSKGSEPDELLAWLAGSLAPLSRIWQWRNAVVHPKDNEKMLVSDFRLMPSGQFAPPSIEIRHPTVPQTSTPASNLLRDVLDEVSASFEGLLAFLCASNAQFGKFQLAISDLPADRRKYPHARYAYFTNLGDQFAPIG
ncbi:hypothetical protein SLT36_21525 [Aminobacter sp. BA135]|uniref:hypothetical protein n=1 Tax=Aminobacter sp. BA135 TaxID=537596 RepID=UPI003D79470F